MGIWITDFGVYVRNLWWKCMNVCMIFFFFGIGLMLEFFFLVVVRLGGAKWAKWHVFVQCRGIGKYAGVNGRVKWDFGIGQLNHWLGYVSARQSLREWKNVRMLCVGLMLECFVFCKVRLGTKRVKWKLIYTLSWYWYRSGREMGKLCGLLERNEWMNCLGIGHPNHFTSVCMCDRS